MYFKVANLKKLRQFWQKCVDMNLCARQTRRSVGPLLLIEPCDLEQREIEQCKIFVQPHIIVHKGAIVPDPLCAM